MEKESRGERERKRRVSGEGGCTEKVERVTYPECSVMTVSDKMLTASLINQ